MKIFVTSIILVIAFLYKYTKAENGKCETNCQCSNKDDTGMCAKCIVNRNEESNFLRTYKKDTIFKNSSIPIINADLFNRTSSPQYLRISDCNINFLKKCTILYSCPLNILILDKNGISEITDGVFNNIEHLIHLDLSQNNISIIQTNVFQGLPVLESLILYWNRLSVVTDNNFSSLRSLRYLSLSNNMISNISEDAFVKLTKLEAFTVSYNRLENINFLLKIASTTKYLDISFNNISYITSTFERLKNLNQLDLSHNEISNIAADTFKGLDGLRILNLSNNKLKDLCQNCFTYLSALQRLFLSNNLITVIDFGSLVDLKKLETITLSFNQLNDIQSDSLLKRQLANVKSIILDHNAWKCNSLKTIADILVKKNITFNSNNDIYINEINIYGIPCSNDYFVQQTVKNSTQKIKMKSSSTVNVLLIFVVLNTILLSTLVIFQVLRYFCGWRKKPVRHSIKNKTECPELEVVNDIYNAGIR